MRYVRDTSLNPYFTETASLMGLGDGCIALPPGWSARDMTQALRPGLGASPACACAHPVSGFMDSGAVKLVAIVGFGAAILYGLHLFAKRGDIDA